MKCSKASISGSLLIRFRFPGLDETAGVNRRTLHGQHSCLNLRRPQSFSFFPWSTSSSSCLVSSSIRSLSPADLLSASRRDISAASRAAIAVDASLSFSCILLFEASNAIFVLDNSSLSRATWNMGTTTRNQAKWGWNVINKINKTQFSHCSQN